MRPRGLAWLVLVLLASHAAECRAAMDPGEVQRVFAAAGDDFTAAAGLLKSDRSGALELLARSIAGFRRIIDEGGVCNGRLFYNIANAYMLSGDVGRAVVNYRRAERLIPGDANLRSNLAYARRRATDRVAPATEERVLRTLFFWHYDLPARARFWVFASTFAAAWTLGALRLTGVLRLRVLWGALALGGVATAIFSSLAVEGRQRAATIDGVIVAEQANGRKGPDEAAYEPSFTEPLHAGVEFRVIEQRPRWALARLGDGRETWLPGACIELVDENRPARGSPSR